MINDNRTLARNQVLIRGNETKSIWTIRKSQVNTASALSKTMPISSSSDGRFALHREFALPMETADLLAGKCAGHRQSVNGNQLWFRRQKAMLTQNFEFWASSELVRPHWQSKLHKRPKSQDRFRFKHSHTKIKKRLKAKNCKQNNVLFSFECKWSVFQCAI